MAFQQLAPPARRTIPMEIEAFCRVLPNYPCCFGETSVIWGGQKPGTVCMDHSAKKNQDVIRRFTWEIASISVHLEELRHFWARTLGISGPQWMIVMALADLDKGEGVPVNAVSKLLHVDPSFVTTQSKLLEKKGFVRRKTSTEDARIVNMSLSDKTYKHLAGLASKQETLNEFIFQEFSAGEINDLTSKLASLKKRLEKACMKVAVDF